MTTTSSSPLGLFYFFIGVAVLYTPILLLQVLVCLFVALPYKAVPPQFRRMPVGQVWLLMIPLFNLVWNFFVFQRVADSFADYLTATGRTQLGRGTQGLGLAYSIVLVVTVPMCTCLSFLGLLPMLAAAVLVILYIVKLYELRALAGAIGSGGFPVLQAMPGMPLGAMPPHEHRPEPPKSPQML